MKNNPQVRQAGSEVSLDERFVELTKREASLQMAVQLTPGVAYRRTIARGQLVALGISLLVGIFMPVIGVIAALVGLSIQLEARVVATGDREAAFCVPRSTWEQYKKAHRLGIVSQYFGARDGRKLDPENKARLAELADLRVELSRLEKAALAGLRELADAGESEKVEE